MPQAHVVVLLTVSGNLGRMKMEEFTLVYRLTLHHCDWNMFIGKHRNVYDETLFCGITLGLDPQEGKIFIKLFTYQICNVLNWLTFQKGWAPFRSLQVSFPKQKPTNLSRVWISCLRVFFTNKAYTYTLPVTSVSSTCLRTKTQMRERDPQQNYKLWIILQWIELWSLNNRAAKVWETERCTVLI